MGLDFLGLPDELVRGGVAGVAFVLLFLAARWRWKGRDEQDAHSDIGLD